MQSLGRGRTLWILIFVIIGFYPSIVSSTGTATVQGRERDTATAAYVTAKPRAALLRKNAINPGPWRAPEAPAAGVLLIASPELRDPNFVRTVVLLLDYDQEGALGVVINRPTEFKLEEILPEADALRGTPHVVYLGGPVDRQRLLLLLRSDNEPENSTRVFSDLHMSGSLDTLENAAKKATTSSDFRAYAGYAGWGPKQLDNEIRRGDWKLQQGTTAIVMRADVSGLWDELIRSSQELWVLKH